MGNLNGYAPPTPPQDNIQDFYAEVDQIRGGIESINANIAQIESLHQRSLNDIDEAAQQTTTHRLEALVSETSALNKNLAGRIKTLKGKASRDPTKAPQVGVLDRNFKDSIRKYQLVEKSFADRTREQMARQYRIVRPDATEEEVRQACEDSQGQQVFSQAVSISCSSLNQRMGLLLTDIHSSSPVTAAEKPAPPSEKSRPVTPRSRESRRPSSSLRSCSARWSKW